VHAHEAGIPSSRSIAASILRSIQRSIASSIAREVSPAAEAHRDLIGEVQAVPAIEEVADGMIAATGALRDPRYSKRPRLIGLGV